MSSKRKSVYGNHGNMPDKEFESDKEMRQLQTTMEMANYPKVRFKLSLKAENNGVSSNNIDGANSSDGGHEESFSDTKKTTNGKLTSGKIAAKLPQVEVNHELHSDEKAVAFCKGCQLHLETKQELKNHFHKHIKMKKRKNLLECDICKQVFSKITNLHDHFSEQHIVSNNYIQEEVVLSSDEDDDVSNTSDSDNIDSSSLKLPLPNNIAQLGHQCRICQSIFNNQSDLKSHLMVEHIVEIYISLENTLHKCKVCERTFNDKEILDEHLMKHTVIVPCGKTEPKTCKSKTVSYICHQCGKRFCNRQSVKRHRTKHKVEDNGPCSCKDCHRKFSNLEKFYLHKDTNRCYSELIQCDICGNVLSNKSSLRDHMTIHNGLTPFKCKACNKLFSSRTKLKYHYKVTHVLPAGERLRHCPYCTKTFIKDEDLSEHMKTHSDTVLTCKHCGKTDIPSRDALRRHQNKHTRMYYRYCHICGNGFSNTNQLNRHIRKHTGERPFPCPQCEKSFSQNENLKTHLRQHSGEKPFMCEHCAQSFTNKCSLVRHMAKHQIQFEEQNLLKHKMEFEDQSFVKHQLQVEEQNFARHNVQFEEQHLLKHKMEYEEQTYY